jgi:hypothetical protein
MFCMDEADSVPGPVCGPAAPTAMRRGRTPSADVERELLAAANANGLLSDPQDGPQKVLATIRSGARAGLQNPRSRT